MYIFIFIYVYIFIYAHIYIYADDYFLSETTVKNVKNVNSFLGKPHKKKCHGVTSVQATVDHNTLEAWANVKHKLTFDEALAYFGVLAPTRSALGECMR